MKRTPEPNLPFPRAAIPEGCSELIDAYRLRAASKAERARFVFRLSVILHDPIVEQIDEELLQTRNYDYLLSRIAEIALPILRSDPELARVIGSPTDLMESLCHVILANSDEEVTQQIEEPDAGNPPD